MAILVVNKRNVDLIMLIQSSINVAEILEIQHEVIKGTMTPNYYSLVECMFKVNG